MNPALKKEKASTHAFDKWDSWGNSQRRVFRTNLVTRSFVKLTALHKCVCKFSKVTEFVVTIMPHLMSLPMQPCSDMSPEIGPTDWFEDLEARVVVVGLGRFEELSA